MFCIVSKKNILPDEEVVVIELDKFHSSKGYVELYSFPDLLTRLSRLEDLNLIAPVVKGNEFIEKYEPVTPMRYRIYVEKETYDMVINTINNSTELLNLFDRLFDMDRYNFYKNKRYLERTNVRELIVKNENDFELAYLSVCKFIFYCVINRISVFSYDDYEDYKEDYTELFHKEFVKLNTPPPPENLGKDSESDVLGDTTT